MAIIREIVHLICSYEINIFFIISIPFLLPAFCYIQSTLLNAGPTPSPRWQRMSPFPTTMTTPTRPARKSPKSMAKARVEFAQPYSNLPFFFVSLSCLTSGQTPSRSHHHQKNYVLTTNVLHFSIFTSCAMLCIVSMISVCLISLSYVWWLVNLPLTHNCPM